jgi:hypothetical protein
LRCAAILSAEPLLPEFEWTAHGGGSSVHLDDRDAPKGPAVHTEDLAATEVLPGVADGRVVASNDEAGILPSPDDVNESVDRVIVGQALNPGRAG